MGGIFLIRELRIAKIHDKLYLVKVSVKIMLKAQDIVLLLKLLAKPEHLKWPQNQLALHLCLSVSEINAGIKRLNKSALLISGLAEKLYQPVIAACEEFLISGVKYMFPAQAGEYTCGIATSYAAPVFKKQIVIGQDPIPVWPYAEGNQRGFSLEPLYSSVPKSVVQYPDQNFYDLLALIDALRQGRARERNIALKLLKKKLNND